MIDLRSDTVTKPTPAMREVMAHAVVGDDVYSDDPTVNELEAVVAELLGKEAAVLVPTGSMSNQIALRTHTEPGDLVIIERGAHIVRSEGGRRRGVERRHHAPARRRVRCLLRGAGDRDPRPSTSVQPEHAALASDAPVRGEHAQRRRWVCLAARRAASRVRDRSCTPADATPRWGSALACLGGIGRQRARVRRAVRHRECVLQQRPRCTDRLSACRREDPLSTGLVASGSSSVVACDRPE